MNTLTVRLRKPIRNDSRRSLTKSECDFILGQDSSISPYPGKCWSIGRDDDGNLSLRWDSSKDGASWAIKEVLSSSKIDWTFFPLESAISCAERAATVHQIPQTVFSNESTSGWWHTSFVAKALIGAKVHVTMLPERYFQ